jgi:hypothetical protein
LFLSNLTTYVRIRARAELYLSLSSVDICIVLWLASFAPH